MVLSFVAVTAYDGVRRRFCARSTVARCGTSLDSDIARVHARLTGLNGVVAHDDERVGATLAKGANNKRMESIESSDVAVAGL